MALVNDKQEILWKEIEQTIGPCAGFSPVKIAAIILNARAMAQLANHFHIIGDAFMQTLCLKRLSHLLKVGNLHGQVVLNLAYGLLLRLLAGHEKIGGINLILFVERNTGKRQWINLFNTLNLIAPIDNAKQIVAIGKRYVHGVSLHSDLASVQRNIVAHIKSVKQAAEQLVAVHRHAHFQVDYVLVKGRGVSHSVDAGHAAHHNYVPATAQEGAGGGKPQLVNLVIDGKVFLNVSVRCGDIGFGLVIVVITDIILHGVVGEELFHLAIELRRKRLVVAQNQCGTLATGNHIGNGKGLSASRHTQKGLRKQAVLKPPHQLVYGFGLVSRRLVGRCKFKFLQSKGIILFS